jgi:hypothetical protein
MTKLVELLASVSGSPFAINPAAVAKVYPSSGDPNLTYIRLMDGQEFGVSGKYQDILRQLTAP